MGLSSSIFNDNKFYCYNRSESLENLQTSNQYLVKMQRLTDNNEVAKSRKTHDASIKEKGVLLANTSISCISQIPNKGFLKLQNLKKKVSKLKKKINSNSIDYSKMFYEFISTWSQKELHALKHEYDALGILKELDKQTNDSRPQVPSLMYDLDGLFKSGLFSDTEISFKGECFKVHRSLLSVRSVFFRQCFQSWKAQPDIMLSSYNSISSSCGSCHHHNKQSYKPIPIHLENPSVTPDVFRSILQYIYTEQLDIDEDQIDNWDMIYLLREKFHLPNRLQFDMKRLFEDTSETDCILVFSQSSDFLSLDYSPFRSENVNKNCNLLNFIRHFHFNVTNSNAVGDANVDETGIEYDNNFLYNVSYELPCHRAILAARSNFFKRIIEIKLRDLNESTESNTFQNFTFKRSFESIVNAPMRITIEENIISHRYARVLLHCLYTGQLNMQLIVTKHYSDRRSPTLDLTASLKTQSTTQLHRFHTFSSEHPSAAGLYIHTFLPTCINCIRDVMQLYQIGSYIEFKLLCHNCEDLLINNISLVNFIEILRWSSEAFGSTFVRRRVISWIREEFMQVVYSQYLPELLKGELIEVISSPFTQAPESEILKAIVKWGESQFELPVTPKECSKDSNIVVILKDLYSKRYMTKSKHFNDPALAKLINDLLQYVNFNHFIPGFDSVKASLIRRGIIQGIPKLNDLSDRLNEIKSKQSWCRLINSRDIATDAFMSPNFDNKYNLSSLDLPQPHYDFNKQHISFKGPRFVTLFYDQLKIIIGERSRNTKVIKCYDDNALADIDSLRPPGRVQPILIPPSQSHFPLVSMQHIHSSGHFNSVNKRINQKTLLNSRITKAIHARVRDLQSGVIVQRALFMPCVSWTAVFDLLRLQALREYGIPDNLSSEIFNGNLNPTRYNNESKPKDARFTSPSPVMSSNLTAEYDDYTSQSLRRKHKSITKKSKENFDSDKSFSYHQSSNTISNNNTPNLKRHNIRNCQCKANTLSQSKNYDLNFTTQSDSHKDKYCRNSYPIPPPVLDLKCNIDHNNSRHKSKHKTMDNVQNVLFSSRELSSNINKEETIRSLTKRRNNFIISSNFDSNIDFNHDDTNNSYNPWVFNGFNFKTNQTNLFDGDLKCPYDSNDSGKLFFGDSPPKTHSPLYGVKKQHHHLMCLACRNLSHSTFHLNLNYLNKFEFDNKDNLDICEHSSREVEL